MDRLDDLVGLADLLLVRVDDVLASVGAPPGHPVWTQLRRVRLLPADAVRAVAGLRPDALADAAPLLRHQARQYADIASSLPAAGHWTGDAADAYDAGRRRMVEHLSADPASLAERLEASADLGAALLDWMWQTRSALAGTLADVLSCAEAVLLTADTEVGPASRDAAAAAAEIGAQLLRTVADAYDAAEDLLDGSAELTDADVPAAAHRTAWTPDR